MPTELLWILLAYFCGTLTFSYWIGKALLRKDIRTYGDANPGGTNFIRAGGRKYLGWGIFVVLLEVFKAMLPILFGAYYAGLDGWWLVALALAPVVGNAFTPFLRFRGSKSMAVIFGMWGGLTFFIVPSLLGLFVFVWIKLLKKEAWGILAAYLTLLAMFLILQSAWFYYPIWLGTFLILIYKWRDGLAQAPDLRQGVLGRFFSQ